MALLFHVVKPPIEDAINPNEVYIYVAPESYFKKYGHLSDQYHKSYDKLSDFDMLMESTFSYEGTKEDVTKLLLSRGLKQDTDFSAFIEAHEKDEEDETLD